MKFLIVEPSPLLILIHLGSKYSPQVTISLPVKILEALLPSLVKAQ
jgi:hypothetical protein